MGQFVTSCSAHQGGVDACWRARAPWGFHPRPLGALDIVDTHDQNVHMPPLKTLCCKATDPVTQPAEASRMWRDGGDGERVRSANISQALYLSSFASYGKREPRKLDEFSRSGAPGGGGCEVEIPRACGSFQAFLPGKVPVSWVLVVVQAPECRAGQDKGERTGALPVAETRRTPRNKRSEESQRLFRRWGSFLRPIRTAVRGCPARARPMA